MGAMDSHLHVPLIVNSTNSKPSVQRPKSNCKTNLHINAWKLFGSEFDFLNALFSFNLEACCDLDGFNRYCLLPLYSEKDSFLTHDIAGQFVYCNPPWSLAVQCVEHICT